MREIGIFVGEKGNWSFFREIYQYLNTHYTTEVFEQKVYRTPLLHGRLNRWAFKQEMQSMLRRSDLCFFEWASELLLPASHMSIRGSVITRLHSYELFVWAPKINWDTVDRVILISDAMRQKFNERYPNQAHKTEVIYNAISLNKFTYVPRDFEFNIGMLANFHPVKRIYEVILMLHSLRKKGFKPHLHIAGERIEHGYYDDYFVSINRLIEKLDLGDRITLHGFVKDTPSWLQNIDIFISNSYWEGQQVALLEAMATGCFCLSHFWDGAEEVLPPENLYATEFELQEKIIAYSQLEEEKKRRCQAHMRDIACEKFDVDKNKIRIHEVIEEVLSNQ